MAIIIPEAVYTRLQEFATLPHESSLLLRAIRSSDSLVYLDLPLVFKGEKNGANPVPNYSEFGHIADDSKEKGYVMIEGHTHAPPESKVLIPYTCGWTFPRLEELREFRDERLRATEQGNRALVGRRSILEAIVRERSPELREEIAKQLIDYSQETATANMFSDEGIDFYITNRVNTNDIDALRRDVNYEGGDFAGNPIRKDKGIDAIALVHADPKFVYSQSSREKFVLSVLEITGSDNRGIKKIPVQIKY